MNAFPNHVCRAAELRFCSKAAEQQREAVQKADKSGNQLGAEDSPLRRAAAFRRGGAEIIQGGTADFLDVSFLETARLRANAVCRIVFRDGRPQGTGWLISDRLLITNNHVIPTAAAARGFLAEFDYERSPDGTARPVTRFELDAVTFFETDHEDDLDYTILALGRRVMGQKTPASLGRIQLSSTPNRHAIGEYVNIIQHPNGDFKQIVLHENRIVTRLDKVLHYLTDTLGGASGSPVFNLRCEVVALHHWGGPHRQVRDRFGRLVDQNANEGIRVSTIMEELRDRLSTMAAPKAALLRAAISGGESAAVINSGDASLMPDESGVIRRIIPVEICVRIPGAFAGLDAASLPGGGDDGPAAPAGGEEPAAERVEIDPNYKNRRGYNPSFHKGHEIPLPKLSAAQKKLAAPNNSPTPGKDKLVLDYVHFSIVMNKARRTAFYCATNIDGKSWKNVDRDTGTIKEDAEAREPWFPEPRLLDDHQANDDDYKGFYQFHRGHLVRRQYPSWGDDNTALRADADTFHFTNCALQHKDFNPRKTVWLGLEDYVLDNARDNDVKVTVFSGPVFRNNDPVFGRLKAPLMFWKVVVRTEGKNLIVMALKASQKTLVKKESEGFDDLPAKLEGYQTTVRDIEKLTGLDFGNLRQFDVLEGQSESVGEGLPITSLEDYITSRPAKTTRSTARRSTGSKRRIS
jgi:endonuclease G, mitochondrial